MSKSWVVETKCLVMVDADDADAAAELAHIQLEQIAFEIEFISVEPW